MKRAELFLMILQVPIDFIMLLLAGVSAYALRFSDWAVTLRPVLFKLSLVEFLNIVWLVGVGWLVIFAFAGLYSTDPNRKMAKDLQRVLSACTVGLAAVAIYVMFANEEFDSRFLVAAGWAFAVVYVSIGRLLIRGAKSLMYRHGLGLRRVAVIGDDAVAETIITAFQTRRELGYQLVGNYKSFTGTTIKKLHEARLDELVFANPRGREEEALKAIEFCNLRHILFKYSADLFATLSGNMTMYPIAGVPVVELRKTPLDGWGRVEKRLFDILLSIVVLILTSPIFLVAAITILLETGRPIIYRNERVGIRGQRFFTLKFRSMYQKDSTGSQFGENGTLAEKKEQELIKKNNSRKGPIYKIINDPRVTPFGRFIRRWSIDELPQFWNVLRGEMSIVGPRPHQPREVKAYEAMYPTVFTLKPGITGLAQISGRSDLDFEEEVKLDIFYTEKWSVMLDFVIFIKTPFVLFRKRKVE